MNKIFTFGLMESVPGSAALGTRDVYNKVGHNTGNLAFHYAINRMIGTVPRAVPWGATPEQIDAAGDVAIMPCANQLGAHMDMQGLANTFSKIKAKVTAIGLGAQAGSNLGIPELPQGTLYWLQQLVDRAPSKHPNITVRGDFTKSVLEHYGFGGNAVSLGCPTLLINKDANHGEKLEERYKRVPRKVAIAAGHPNWKHLSALEASLVRIMEDTHGSYIVQATDELVALSRNEFSYVKPEYLENLKSYLKLNLDPLQFHDWVRRYFISFYNIPAWMEYLRRFDFIVGARIHGVMLGIQAGVPGLCIAHDSRIRELCEKCQIPYVLADDVKNGITVRDLMKLSKFDGKSFDRNRAEIVEQYRLFVQNNGIA